jgi:hypothetical protein
MRSHSKSESIALGWVKAIGGIRQVMVRGLKKVDQMFVLTMPVYNLVRMRTSGKLRAQGRNERSQRRRWLGTALRHRNRSTNPG